MLECKSLPSLRGDVVSELSVLRGRLVLCALQSLRTLLMEERGRKGVWEK